MSMPLSGKSTVDALADEWSKLLAIYMLREGIKEIVITTKDIEAVGKDGQMENCIVVQELQDGLHIKMMKTADAIALAKQNKRGFSKS